MVSDEARWRNVDRSQDEKPSPNELIVHLLKGYGIPYDRVYGRFAKGDSFTGDNRFGDYVVRLVGVSTGEELPGPPLAWQIQGEEYYCWQILILYKDYPGIIDAAWREEYDHYEVVAMWGSLEWLNSQTLAVMDEGMKLLLLISERMTKVMRGGRRNVKVADLPEEIRRALGKRYEELKDDLTTAKRDVQTLIRLNQDWRSSILKDAKYGVLKNHPDLLEDLHLRGGLDPWQIAIQIAAREIIPGYVNNNVSANTLKNIAILPNNNTK
ncbi:MAG: hypothetical protein V7641_2453 [Blastocatellia bacterium]